MNKLFIIAFIFLSVVLACHPSCATCDGTVCLTCKHADIGAQLDLNNRSCPCPSGYYTGEVYPDYECIKFVNTNNNSDDTSVAMDACKIEIGMKTNQAQIDTNCSFSNIDGNSFVISQISLDLHLVSFDQNCLTAYRTSVQYLNVNTGQYENLDIKYITDLGNGAKKIQFPLIDIFNYAVSTNVGDEQIVQIVNLQLLIGHDDDAVVRKHKWELDVFTNRDQVQVFQIDVDILETEGCQPGQECIIVADLDTEGKVYTDGNFNEIKAELKYLVGDNFYARITFADPTYTKSLSFETLYFRNEQGKIFNFSSITSASWDGSGLRISLPLVEPSQGATIQINMKINATRLRFLQSGDDSQSVQKQFSANVESVVAKASNTDSTSNISLTLIFGLLNLVSLILFI